MPKVYNKRRSHQIPNGAVYVGRPTIFGNPFSKGSKEKNIADFREYAEKRVIQEPEWLKPLREKHVICWCAPSACHGEVLIELANKPDLDLDNWADENAPDPSAEWERSLA